MEILSVVLQIAAVSWSPKWFIITGLTFPTYFKQSQFPLCTCNCKIKYTFKISVKRWTPLPNAAANIDKDKQAYTFLRWLRVDWSLQIGNLIINNRLSQTSGFKMQSCAHADIMSYFLQFTHIAALRVSSATKSRLNL